MGKKKYTSNGTLKGFVELKGLADLGKLVTGYFMMAVASVSVWNDITNEIDREKKLNTPPPDEFGEAEVIDSKIKE